MNAPTAAADLDFGRDLRSLVAQTIEIMACHGCDRRYSAVSPALAELLRCSARVLIGKTDLELTQQFQQPTEQLAGQQTYWQQVADAIATVFQTGQAEIRILSLLTEAGLQHYQTTYTPLRDEQNQVCQVLSISRAIASSQLPLTESARSHTGAEMPGLETASLTDIPVADILAKPSQTGRSIAESSDRTAAPAHYTAEFMQVVLDSIPQYIFWKNKAGVYLGSNHRWARMAGFEDSSQVPGVTDDALPWTPEQRSWYRQCDLEVMNTDTPMLRIKQSQQQANGQLSWRETSKFPLHDSDGNVVGLLGTIEDITERKVAEDLLKQSEATFRKLAKQGEILNRLSGQVRRSLRLSEIGQTTVEEVRQLFAVDRALIYRFDSEWNGRVIVEALADSWPSLLGEAGADSRVHYQYVEQYQRGYVHAIADIDSAELDTHHRDFLQSLGVRANLVVPILVKDTLWGLLIAHQCSGPKAWEEGEIDLLKTLAGQVGVAIHQSNLLAQAESSAKIAQQKAQQLETTLQTLQQAQTQLVQSEKMSSLGQMVAGIAHEINNPVNFIHGNIKYVAEYAQDLLDFLQLYETYYPNPSAAIQEAAEALEIEFLQEDLQKTLSSMRMGTQRIREIVLSLRNFSRIDEAGCKAIDIHEGIESTLLILQHRIKGQGDQPPVNIVRDFGDLPLVECFASQLNQVFMNVLANAIDALESDLQSKQTAEKVPQITLRTEANDSYVVVSIADNGTGIPSAIRERIFDPFFTTKSVGKGTGMGMAISYQIVVEKHQGQIECLSEEGVGTEFVITVPIKL